LRRPAEAETLRLACRRPREEDLPDYERLFLDPAVGRWLRPPPMEPLDRHAVARILEHDLLHWQQHRFGPWLLLSLDGGEFVGRGGLAWTRVEGRPMVELPWSLLPEFQGRGLASESAAAALKVASSIGLKHVVSLALLENDASRRVMEKIGLSFERKVEHAGLPHALYGIDLRVWGGHTNSTQQT
jgi:ribosomal-protein-alanine N-acetyltransferase